MAGKIFISYRRSDSEVVAHRIYDRLRQDFGLDAAFIDIDKMPFADFRVHITEQVRRARVVLVVIGPGWLRTVQDGARRADDWVRVEIETALAAGVPVAPVRIGGAAMPGADELPPSIAEIAYINAVPVSPTDDFHPHMDRLAGRLVDTFGLERRIGAPGLAKARPATAELVVASSYRGPAVPPPRVSERWELIQAPDLSKFAWDRAAWVGRSDEYSSLAVINKYQGGLKPSRIGLFDPRLRIFEPKPVTSFWEHLRSGEMFSRINQLAPNRDTVIACSHSLLYRWNGSYVSILQQLTSDEYASHFEPERYIVTETNVRGQWAHIYRKIIGPWSGQSVPSADFLDIYRNDDRIASFEGKWLLDNPAHFEWSPSGCFGLVRVRDDWGWGHQGFWLYKIDSDGEAQNNWRIPYFGDYDNRSKFPRHSLFALPAECNGHAGSASWHPTKDLIAFAVYQGVPNLQGGSDIADWRLVIADVPNSPTLYSNPLPIMHSKQLHGRLEPALMAWSATGRFVAAMAGGCVHLWDLETDHVRQLFGHDREMNFLAFSPDGMRLLSAGAGQCIVWDPVTGEKITSWPGYLDFRGIRPSPWAPSGAMIATSYNGLEVRRLIV